MGTRETRHRAEPHRCSHRLLSDASPSRQQAERGVHPPAAVDGEVRAVLVDPGAEAGRAEFEGHRSPPAEEPPQSVATLQVDLDHAVRILALEEPRYFHRVVLLVAVAAARRVALASLAQGENCCRSELHRFGIPLVP